jgi:sugar (pentulose or hexulose) kinase
LDVGATIVIDIGKTFSKLTLWDRTGTWTALRKRANVQINGALDVAGLEEWLAQKLSEFARLARVSAIIPVAHGAAAALVRGDQLVCPPRDYESPIAADIRAAYDQLRPSFAKTGSPALPDGLNLGAQLFAVQDQMAEATILLWPQYWSWLLSGVASSEVTSLGTHTDLWNPATGSFSTLVERLGWDANFPPLRAAGDSLGPITPEWAARTGLPADTQIHCGVHDSNAALVAARGFAEMTGQEATLLSTGTWFIAMRTPSEPVDLALLPEARDCLVNVDVHGCPIPSARFMGGREIELLGERIDQAGLDGLADVITNAAMILPSFVPGCGPFPGSEGQWVHEPRNPDQRRAAVSLYLALHADTALDLIGSRSVLLIEGRFAQSEILIRALATLRPDTHVYTSLDADVSFGALRLVHPSIKPDASLERVSPLPIDLSLYKAAWQKRIKEGNAA